MSCNLPYGEGKSRLLRQHVLCVKTGKNVVLGVEWEVWCDWSIKCYRREDGTKTGKREVKRTGGSLILKLFHDNTKAVRPYSVRW